MRPTRDLVAVIMATSVGLAIIFFSIGIGVYAISSGTPLSENATQVLVASFSGIIGALAGYIGGRVQPPGGT